MRHPPFGLRGPAVPSFHRIRFNSLKKESCQCERPRLFIVPDSRVIVVAPFNTRPPSSSLADYAGYFYYIPNKQCAIRRMASERK